MKSSKKRSPLKVRRRWTRSPTTRIKESRKKYSRKKIFKESDFVDHVWSVMKDQEKTNPLLELLHERLTSSLTLIGLTGGIACGKSLVSGFFRDLGMPVIDADQIARQVVEPGQEAYQKILTHFGTLHRAQLAEIIFSDPEKKKVLESITHPAIFKEIAEQVRQLIGQGQQKIVIDAALLFESGLDKQMDWKILVRVDPVLQLKRLIERDHLSELQAKTRLEAQMPPSEKEKLAHFVIDNSGTPEDTRKQLLLIIPQMRPQAHQR